MTPFFAVFILLFLKLILLRYFFFDGIEWLRLATDALAVLSLLSILELLLPSRAKGVGYWMFNLIFSLLLFSSTVYFNHFNSIPTYTALNELHQVTKIKSSIQSTLKWSDFIYFVDVFVFAFVWIIYRIRGVRIPRRTSIRKTGMILTAIISLALSAIYINNGKSIANELAQAENLGFFDYQVAAALKAKEENIAVLSGNIQDTIAQVDALQASYPYQSDKLKTAVTPAYFGKAKGKNLIMVQMEAFQNFPIHLTLDGQPVTPVLNQLASEGLYFPNVFQEIGQGNTSDAEFMSNTSIYPTGTVAMSSGFGDRELPSLPRLLQKYNYEASTFHVNDVGFWDRSKLYPALHFNQYYDKPFYNNDHFNDFGASDEELYRVGVDKLSASQSEDKPFYGQFVTVSSHFPFKIPDDQVRINIPANMQGTEIGEYIKAVNYTDYAIGTLVEKLKANGMWDDTVLVFYGDHFGLQPQDIDPSTLSTQLGIHYDERITRFNIPLIIHIPGQTEGKVITQVGGQLDIMPTVANLLGISLSKEKFTAFGHDLMNTDKNIIGSRYYLPTGSFFNNDILFVPGKGFEDGKAVSLKTMEPLADFTKYKTDYDYILKLMNLSDTYVKMLPKR
ncbi:phosphoglycerol transferase MdoB-like AlkP superfamily enzyme [Paenibacillus shirakamiensis]|uniref:Phosphoglycerol transferase MdoB-like AlkP superfamily enzyme n=1 Tax=Paenibacillus shirakamiensis TaxID=1265935 RepID=A0ABS4JL26_9BACL|nr:phosphoglycerol transferase MdoB-like AlkP superfamily enzyme [Paenibacillus shirakamiensis]